MERTSLYQKHIHLGAKMVSFSGFEMPLQYSGIINEHLTVRTKVGCFDLSHMGEFKFYGSGVEVFLQRMLINDVSKISPGQAQYTAMCFENGGIVDDCVLYRMGNEFLMVVNASNIKKDFNWLSDYLSHDAQMMDVSDEISLIAVQGPESKNLLKKVIDHPDALETLAFYHHTTIKSEEIEFLCTRTGYTGELGYELYVKNEDVELLWDRLFLTGSQYGMKPIGLGARDTLRMEMKYCLYGNDIDETTNPLESGLGWITKLDKKNFIGQEAIQQNKKNGLTRKLVGFEMKERSIPRNGYNILVNGNVTGTVTSGCYSPSLGKGIGLGYVKLEHASIGPGIDVDIRGKLVPAEVVETPFWKNGTVI